MLFIAMTITFCNERIILSDTYATPSCGRIKQVKSHFKNPTQGSQCVIEFLQHVKTCDNELAILEAPMKEEDLIEKFFFYGFNDEYKEFVQVMQACETPIMCTKLHENLLNFEAFLQTLSLLSFSFLIIANLFNRKHYWVASSYLRGQSNGLALVTLLQPTIIVDYTWTSKRLVYMIKVMEFVDYHWFSL